MARKKTTIDLVLSLPTALTNAVLGAMTPDQKNALTASQAGQILRVTTNAAGEIARILDPQPPGGPIPRKDNDDEKARAPGERAQSLDPRRATE